MMKAYKPVVSQQLIWLDQALSPGSARYNIGGYAYLEGMLDLSLFEKAIRQVLVSQEVYASCFYEEEGVLQVALIDPSESFTMEVLDMTGHEDPVVAAREWMRMDFAKPFEVVNNYLFTFRLLKVSDKLHYWYAKIHHLISDGWSFKLLLNQAAAFYDALVDGKESTVTVYRYSDYALDDENYYASTVAADDRRFWLGQFRQLPSELFPLYSAGPSTRYTAGSEVLYLSREQKAQLQQLAEEQKVSLFHIIVSLLLIYFSRTREKQTIVAAVPALNRTKKVYRSTAGIFMNLLALPFEVQAGDTICELLQQVKHKMSAVLRHQRYQYGSLVKELPLATHQALYEIRVSYEDFDFTSNFGGLGTGAIALSNHEEVDKLAIYLRDYHDQGFDIRMVYNPGYFDQPAIQDIGKSLSYMADLLPAYIQGPVAAIPLQQEDTLALIEKIATGTVEERPDSFLREWAGAIASYPDRIAVSTSDSTFTYAEINRQAQRIAAALNQQYAEQDTPIALFLPRSEKMITAILGSMMAGQCYIPLDPEYPQERIAYILQDAGCGLVLTSEAMHDEIRPVNGATILLLEELLLATPATEDVPAIKIVGDHPCYIIYTSGSTGIPKGVLISHRSLADYAVTFKNYFKLTYNDTVLQQATFNFDTSVEEIFPILAAGGRLHILKDRRDIDMLLETLVRIPVTIVSTTPFVIKYLNEHVLPASLRLLISGGDVLKINYLPNILQQNIQVYNTYGPTESTVCATFYKVNGNESVIPIGKPIPNREVYILNEQLQIQPLGVEGQIYLGGEGLALRYVNDPVLTGTRFVKPGFKKGLRLYKTGDRGIMRPDGNIVFKGRTDDQVNYRGYRIEAAEIEQKILQLDGVEDCVVTVADLQDIPRLVAYIQYKEAGHLSAMEWRILLRNQLPTHMIPEIWMAIPQIPLLLNGKVNRKALPALDTGILQQDQQQEFVPATNKEKAIANIWTEVLQLPAIGSRISFFEAGGHSLHMMQLLNRYHQAFDVRLSIQDLFTYTTIEEHAQLIHTLSANQYIPIPQVPVAADYDVSDGQRRLWLLSQLEGGSQAYHLYGQLSLAGTCVPACWGKAVQQVIARHEILRTVFVENQQGEIRQVVLPAMDVRLDYIGCRDENDTTAYIRDLREQPFDLERGPLLRAILIAFPSGYQLHFCMHHIISDGWSMELLGKEVLSYYEAFSAGTIPVAGSLPVQYKDYTAWQQKQLLTEESKAERDYWLGQLSGDLPVLDLPADTVRPVFVTNNGERLSALVGNSQAEQLRVFCKAHNCTLFMGLLGALYAILYRYTGQTDIILGTPVAGRDHVDLEDQVGFYVNTLALRTRINDKDSFVGLLDKVRTVTREALEHQHYPFERLVNELQLERNVSRSAIFDMMFVLQNQHQQQDGLAGDYVPASEQDIIGKGSCAVKYDIYLECWEKTNGLVLNIEYNTAVYTKETMMGFIRHFKNLLQGLLVHPHAPVSEVAYLSATEQYQLLETFNDTACDYGHGLTLPGLFHKQVMAHPEKVALRYRDKVFSYGELDRLSAQLAVYLQDRYAIRGEERVAVSLRRSEWMIISLLAILRTGAAYVPVDPAYPQERIDYLLLDSQCSVCIGQAMIDDFLQVKDEYIQGPYPVTIREQDLAYMIYTSGSSGKPKGCMLEHKGVVNRIEWMWREYGFTASDIILQKTTFTFDVSVWEIFMPLCWGCEMVLCEDEDVYAPERLVELIAQHQVTCLHFIPGMLSAFTEELMAAHHAPGSLSSLRCVITSGEALPVQTLKKWYGWVSVPVYNLYGPTEASIDVTYFNTTSATEKVYIGKPVANTSLYVLDEHKRLVPPGVAGELFIGGVQLARGYWNRPDLTKEKFISNPYKPGERLYSTGDKGRWARDGNIEYLGRMDTQVKIRGYRIEPEEIEHALLQIAAIRAAVVVAMDNHERGKELVAYVVGHEIQDATTLKQQLLLQLPAYMVPAHIVQLNSLPLTANGKINRGGLPAPGIYARHNEERGDIALSETAAALLKIYQRVLKQDGFSVRDNFFSLGGNSMLLIKVRHEIRTAFDVSVQIKELYKLATVEEVAAVIDAVKWLQQGTVTAGNNPRVEFSI